MELELETNIINWSDPNQPITKNFTVKDCLMLHNWNRLATSADGADFTKLTILCNKLEEIRSILGYPINIHSMFRSQEYNREQNINPNNDAHAQSLAADFDCGSNLTIQEIKDKLIPLLDNLNIRMEKGTTTWVHIDLHSVGPSGRYFTA